MSERVLRGLIVAVAAVNLALGLWMALAPRSFFDAIADFGRYNSHDLRDISTWYLATGAALLLAAPRAGWRVPLLLFAAVQSSAHMVNHLIDVGDSEPSWVGPVDVLTLAAAAVLLGWIAWVARGHAACGRETVARPPTTR